MSSAGGLFLRDTCRPSCLWCCGPGLGVSECVQDFVVFELQYNLSQFNPLSAGFCDQILTSDTHISRCNPVGCLKITFWFSFTKSQVAAVGPGWHLNLNWPRNRCCISHRVSESSHIIHNKSQHTLTCSTWCGTLVLLVVAANCSQMIEEHKEPHNAVQLVDRVSWHRLQAVD